MIDLHNHSFLSDGVLIPSELVRRAEDKGLRCIAITDHADESNLENIIAQLKRVCSSLTRNTKVTVIPGVEISHVPPGAISSLVKKARRCGAKLVLVHGETIVEPVKAGTNRAAIESRVDILAHPGLISPDDAKLAKNNSVCLEVSGRPGHSLSNGHVVRLAKEIGVKLTFGSDSHEPDDMFTPQGIIEVCCGAGLNKTEVGKLFREISVFLKGKGISATGAK